MVTNDGGSLVPTSGGIVSVGGRHASLGRGRRHSGAPCKESYASALRGQIEAKGKAAQQARAAEMLIPCGNVVASTIVELTAEQKAGYGAALREQMAADRQGRTERRAAEDSLDRALLQGQNFTPRRLLRPTPPRPATESYAAELERQMADQQVQRRANAEAFKTPAPTGVGGMPSEDPPVEGRRTTFQAPARKSDYASELRDQMAERETRALREQSRRTPEEERAPFAFVKTVAPRGIKTDFEKLSPDSYISALQEQMAERAADREARAHHRQATPRRRDPATPRQHAPNNGRAAPSKAEYAAMLEEQIADRNLHRARAGGASGGLTSQAAAGGAVIPMGGDEHVFRPRPIENVEPVAYQEQLREQISGRRAQRHAQAFHAQRPEEAAAPTFLPQAPTERARGKRVVGQLAALETGSAGQYAADLRQQIAQREGMMTEWRQIEDARLARQLNEAHRQAADRQGAIDRARQHPRPAEARDALDHFMGGVLPW